MKQVIKVILQRIFYEHMFYARPSCYECKFKGYPRIADITLADFWKIEKIDKTLDKDLGTSLVMINSEKRKKIFLKK